MNEDGRLGELVARVSPEAVTGEMIATFRHSIPGYERLPERVIAGQIQDVALRNVELCFRLMPEGRLPEPEELEPFIHSARDRATEGMPLEDLLHAYRLGGRLGWRAIVAAAGPDETDMLILAAERVMGYVDSVSSAVARAYLDQSHHLVSEEERRLRDLFDALCVGAPLSSALRGLAERIGFPDCEDYRPFAATVPGAPGRRHAELAADLRRRGVLALTEGDRVAGVLAPDAGAALRPEPGALLAVEEPVPRTAIGDALDRLRLLLELAERRGLRGRIEPADFPLEMLLAAAPAEGEALARAALAPLEATGADRGGALVETLNAFLEQDLDRRRTAKALHVHPNTVDYRLRRVRELTGLDLGRPADAAVLVLALRQRTLGAG